MYKNKFNGYVISEADYNRLPWDKKSDYYRVYDEEVTHGYSDDDDSFIAVMGIAIGIGEITATIFDSSDSSSDSSFDDSSSSDFDFGGGDFGGAGAGGEF